MSDNLVKRLREHVEKRGGASFQNGAWDMMLSAADRIEKLEAMLETVMRSAGYPNYQINAALGEKKDVAED